MAADEKTEKATPKRKQDERKKGNVFQSSDVAAVASLLAVFNGLKIFASFMYKSMYQGVILFFGYARMEYPVNSESLQDKLIQAMLLFAQDSRGNGSGGGGFADQNGFFHGNH